MKPKDIKALAKACRDAGITHFKNSEIEFTLGDHVPAKAKRKSDQAKAEVKEIMQDLIDSDGWDNLSLEDKLNWSSSPIGEAVEESSN